MDATWIGQGAGSLTSVLVSIFSWLYLSSFQRSQSLEKAFGILEDVRIMLGVRVLHTMRWLGMSVEYLVLCEKDLSDFKRQTEW